MYHIGICDDEKGTCAILEDFIYEYGKKRRIKVDVSVWYDGESLCDFLKNENVLDMLFLDIELSNTDGIQVGNYIREELENMETIIVYISSKSSYAMKLFQVQPLDFLIKPLSRETVEKILSKACKLYELKNQVFEYSSKGYYYKVPYKEIIYFYSQNKIINIVMKNETKQFNGKLKKIAETVPYNFIIIHQSYLINLDYMVECSYESVKMFGEILLTISQPYRKLVRERIMQNKWEKAK